MAPSDTLRLAVFDCDGTLVDSQHSIVAAMQAACGRHGLKPPAHDAVKRLVGLPLLDCIRILLPGSAEAVVGRVREAYAEVFHAMRMDGQVTDPLFFGAREAIEAVERAGWLLGLATGKSHRGLIATLERHELVERFVTLQTADRAAGKPNPEMLLNAMAETGVSPASTVMIGDTTYDMEMARNAGTLAIGVAWGYHEADELRDAGAHAIIGAFPELPLALHGLMEKVA